MTSEKERALRSVAFGRKIEDGSPETLWKGAVILGGGIGLIDFGILAVGYRLIQGAGGV